MKYKLTVTELKEYIVAENKIPLILESIGCTGVKYHQSKNYYSCANKDGDNKTAISIKNNEHINCINYTRAIGENADIISLIMFNNDQSFPEAIKWLHNLFNLKFAYEKKRLILRKKQIY